MTKELSVSENLNKIRGIANRNMDILLFVIIIYLKCLLFNYSLFLNGIVYTFTCIGSILMLVGIAMLFKKRARIVILLILDVLITVIIISNVTYFRYYNDVLSVPVFMQIGLVDSALSSSIINLIKLQDIVFIIDIIVFALLAIRKGKNITLVSENLGTRFGKAVVVLLLGATLTIYGFYDMIKVIGMQSFLAVFDHTYILENFGVINYHGVDCLTFVNNNVLKNKITSDEKSKVENFLNNKRKFDETTKKELKGIANGKNLIIVQCEALQNNVINLKIGEKEVTPNINKFLSKCIYYDNYYTQIAQGNTSDAEFVSNNSLYPLSEGAVYFRYPQNSFNSLANYFKVRNYSTMAMHGYKPSYWNRATMYPLLGFDRFFSANDYKDGEMLGRWGTSDKNFFSQSIKNMNQAKKPFFSFLVTLSTHYPYEIFRTTNGFDSGKYKDSMTGDYLSAMNYLDSALGEFISTLEKEGLLSNSVLVIYGDHEGLKRGEVSQANEIMNLRGNDDISYLNMLRVPLLIHLPSDEHAKKDSKIGGQIDLVPTIANLFGYEPKTYLGKDLINSNDSYVVLRDGSYISDKSVYFGKTKKSFDIKTQKELTIDELNTEIKMAKEQLEISELIIKYNLVKYFDSKKTSGK